MRGFCWYSWDNVELSYGLMGHGKDTDNDGMEGMEE